MLLGVCASQYDIFHSAEDNVGKVLGDVNRRDSDPDGNSRKRNGGPYCERSRKEQLEQLKKENS